MNKTPAGLPNALTRALSSPHTTVVLALVAAIVAMAIQQLVYPAFSWNRDEPVYLWQAELLRQGALTAPDGGFPELLHPWLSGWRDGEFFTQYPVGWPIIIMAGALIAWPGAALSVAAALAVSGVCLLTYELLRDRVIANAAGLVFVASPIFAVQGGVFLTYLFTLGLGLWFCWLFLAAIRLRSPGRAVAAGVFFGWIVCTRTFDAALWALVAGVYVAVVERGRWRSQLVTAGFFIAGVAPFIVLQLLHNRLLTGSVFTFPITEKDPLDSFGFGSRRLMPSFEAEPYGPKRALYSTAKHGFFLPWFLMGSYLGAIVAGVGVWWRRRARSTWFLLGLIAVFPVAYFPFWGNYVSSLTVRLSGPIYYVPLYAPLAILIAVVVVELARRRPRLATALVVVMAVITVPLTAGRLGLNRALSRGQIAWGTSVEELDEPSLVVVAASSYLMYLNPYSANPLDLDGDILYATNSWPSLFRLIRAHPERTPYLQRATLSPEELLPSEHPERAEIVLDPIEIIQGDAMEVRLTITPPRDEEAVWLHTDVGGDINWDRLTDNSRAGFPIEVSRILVTDTSSNRYRNRADAIMVSGGEQTVTFGASFGTTTRRTQLTPHVGKRYHAQTADGIELMTPAISFRARQAEDQSVPTRWDEVFDVPELQVELRPLPSTDS